MLKNFRDLGGILVDDSTVTRSCLFCRSEAPNKIKSKDFEALVKEHNVGYVIDLRTNQERRENPNIMSSSVQTLEIPVFDEAKAGISHEKGGFKQKLAAAPDMVNLYGSLATDSDAIAAFSKIFRFLLDKQDDKAVLIHCTAGKDRTGMMTALLLSALGVSKDKIYEDYMKSNVFAKRIASKYYRLVLFLSFNKKIAEKVRDLFVVKPEYLASFFDEIDKNYGNISNFFATQLHLTSDDMAKLRSIYCTNI